MNQKAMSSHDSSTRAYRLHTILKASVIAKLENIRGVIGWARGGKGTLENMMSFILDLLEFERRISLNFESK